MKVFWVVDAQKDLDEIGQHIARNNAEAALRVLDRIEERADFLSDFPESGRPGKGGRRELVVTGTPYIIFYRLTGHQIEILAVMHGARDR